MISVFLSIILRLSILSNNDESLYFLGKWRNISDDSSIKQVTFLPDNNVKFSNEKYLLTQRYSLTLDNNDHSKFTGVFKFINVGRLVKETKFSLKLIDNNLMELNFDDKRIILKRG